VSKTVAIKKLTTLWTKAFQLTGFVCLQEAQLLVNDYMTLSPRD